MNLLIITQRVDYNDKVLGFFMRWIEEFAKHYHQVTVIGQWVDSYNLPSNVRVHSLGKKEKKSKLAQIYNFEKFIWRERSNYDVVFVHMAPIWIVPGFLIWRFLHKPMYLWYEARGKRWPLRFALLCARKVFSASIHGMPITTKKSVITGHGIDAAAFAFGNAERDGHLLITVGRCTAAKRIDMILDCFQHIQNDSQLELIGVAITPEDRLLKEQLRHKIDVLKLEDRVKFKQFTQKELIPVLKKASCFLHASETSLDKAVLEAMACGCPVVSTSAAFKDLLPTICQATDAESMARQVAIISAMPSEERSRLVRDLRAAVVENHSLERLMDRLVQEMTYTAPRCEC